MKTQLYRSRSDTVIGGVCGGLAPTLDMDPSLVRLLFVLVALLGGASVLVYLILWLVVPLEGQISPTTLQETPPVGAATIALRPAGQTHAWSAPQPGPAKVGEALYGQRTTFILAAAAFVVVALATPFALFGLPLAPAAALLLGAAAGWGLRNTRRADTGTRGANAGAVVGIGALLGSMVGLAVLALVVGNIPAVQSYIPSSEPHPAARIPLAWIAPLSLLAGGAGGFILGLFDLALAAVAGWATGRIYAHNHPIPA